MKVSIAVTNYSWPGGQAGLPRRLGALARRADQCGVDTIWVADHLLQVEPGRSAGEPMLEACTTLGYLAAVTERVRLGTLVAWVTIRPPAVLVKAVTTLDVLSGGRAWLGVGAGYRGDEAAMLGLPFPPVAERFDLLEDLLRLAHQMWRDDREPFTGKVVRLEEPICSPAPVRRPRILVGGAGEKRTLPLVARYADAANLFDIPDAGATVRHKLEVLHRACEQVGRDPSEIEVTLSTRLAPGESATQFADRCNDWRSRGIQHLVLVGNGPWPEDDLDLVCETIR